MLFRGKATGRSGSDHNVPEGRAGDRGGSDHNVPEGRAADRGGSAIMLLRGELLTGVGPP
jgi:hypothetical protein